MASGLETSTPFLARTGLRKPRMSALEAAPPDITLPATLDVRLLSPDMAEQATWLRGVERVTSTDVRLEDDDPLRLYRTLMTLVFLTRSLVETS